jgi:hypothetical protein
MLYVNASPRKVTKFLSLTTSNKDGNMYAHLNEIMGKTMKTVTNTGEAIVFECDDGDTFSLHHEQDCCEHVTIDEVHGDLADLVGTPLIQAEEEVSYNDGPANDYTESYTWSFYKFATIKGYVTVKFYGESNGYYSESANLYKI